MSLLFSYWSLGLQAGQPKSSEQGTPLGRARPYSAVKADPTHTS